MPRDRLRCTRLRLLVVKKQLSSKTVKLPVLQFETAKTYRWGPLETLQRRVAASDVPWIGCVAQGEAARWLGHKNRVKSFRTVSPKRCTVSSILSPEKNLDFCWFLLFFD